MRLPLVMLALLSMTALARADIVHLKNGSKIEGRIVKETAEQVVVLVPGVGKLDVDRGRIERIERTAPPKEPAKDARPARPG